MYNIYYMYMVAKKCFFEFFDHKILRNQVAYSGNGGQRSKLFSEAIPSFRNRHTQKKYKWFVLSPNRDILKYFITTIMAHKRLLKVTSLTNQALPSLLAHWCGRFLQILQKSIKNSLKVSPFMHKQNNVLF